MSRAAMLAEARKHLGLSGRPNRITRDYASRHGSEFLTAPWCDQGVTFVARKSGNAAAVLPHGDRAWTVAHAQDGHDLKRWYPGTAANLKAHAEPGDIVFFDWDGTDSIQRIDHVGIIERNLGDGRIQSIEFNTSDAVKRRVRSSSVIAGFFKPNYAAKPEKNWTEALVDTLPLLKPGAKGWAVKRAFYLLMSHGYPLDPETLDPTVYSPAMKEQVLRFQADEKLKVDGQVGEKTWVALVSP